MKMHHSTRGTGVTQSAQHQMFKTRQSLREIMLCSGSTAHSSTIGIHGTKVGMCRPGMLKFENVPGGKAKPFYGVAHEEGEIKCAN